MITTSHFIIGGALGVATGNPYAALAVGIVSHFVADAIPHFDVPPSAPRNDKDELVMTKAIWTQVWVDGLIGLVVIGALWASKFDYPTLSPFVLGAFGGFFPDLIDNVPFWNKAFRKTRIGHVFHKFHESTHELWEDRFPMRKYAWLGILTQLVSVGIALNYLFSV